MRTRASVCAQAADYLKKRVYQMRSPRKPSIVIGKTDHARLNKLALAAYDRLPEIADRLLLELERARVVADHAVPANVVRMGSTVEYETTNGNSRAVTLVFPAEADISEGKVSILTPIGTTLLGLAAGQTMEWTARDDKPHKLTVTAVDPLQTDADVSKSELISNSSFK
jgi:regulator of nucleoside diphosphate kinase